MSDHAVATDLVGKQVILEVERRANVLGIVRAVAHDRYRGFSVLVENVDGRIESFDLAPGGGYAVLHVTGGS
jgi:hypothetical protein